MNVAEINHSQNEGKDSVAVIGGGASWGKRVVDACEQMSRVGRVEIIEWDTDTNESLSIIDRCNVIFIASPDVTINDHLIKIQSRLGPNKAIIDCATNKNSFASTLTNIAHAGTSVCSTHPMVRPETATRGHGVLIMPLGQNPDFAKEFAVQIYEKMDMTIEEVDFYIHSDLMVFLQMVPHISQRVQLDAMVALEELGMTIDDVSRFAPANYILGELALNRVAWQLPDVTAGIVATGLQTELGKKTMDRMQRSLAKIRSAGDDREALSLLFEEAIKRLDPERKWRERVNGFAEAVLSRLGNLKRQSFRVSAKNQIGTLRDITTILAAHKIDIIAIDSQIFTTNDPNNSEVMFDIGIADQEYNEQSLQCDLNEIDASLVKQ